MKVECRNGITIKLLNQQSYLGKHARSILDGRREIEKWEEEDRWLE